MKFKLQEAFDQAKAKGITIKKNELAKIIWGDKSKSTLQVNMTSLLNGTTKRIEPKWVDIICKELQTTPNKLFGTFDNFLEEIVEENDTITKDELKGWFEKYDEMNKSY